MRLSSGLIRSTLGGIGVPPKVPPLSSVVMMKLTVACPFDAEIWSGVQEKPGGTSAARRLAPAKPFSSVIAVQLIPLQDVFGIVMPLDVVVCIVPEPLVRVNVTAWPTTGLPLLSRTRTVMGLVSRKFATTNWPLPPAIDIKPVADPPPPVEPTKPTPPPGVEPLGDAKEDADTKKKEDDDKSGEDPKKGEKKPEPKSDGEKDSDKPADSKKDADEAAAAKGEDTVAAKQEEKKGETEKDDSKKPADEKKDDKKKEDAPADKPKADSDDAKKDDVKKDDAKPAEPKKDLKAEYFEAIKRYDAEKGRFVGETHAFEAKVAAGKQKVQELNDRFADWYYVISNDSFDKLRLTRDALVKPKEKKAGEKIDGENKDENNDAKPATKDEKSSEKKDAEKTPTEKPDGNGAAKSASKEEKPSEKKEPEKKADEQKEPEKKEAEKPAEDK